jgi:DNA-binding XRE family transcriptional regulator
LVETGEMLMSARRAAGVSQEELARRAGTSRPTLSAYERGRKSPSLVTAQRLLGQVGFELAVQPRVGFVERPGARGRVVVVPTGLPRLDVDRALARVVLPLHLNWSSPGRGFDLRDRRQRALVYEMVLREGTPEDVLAYIDGVLLVDLWDELVLPRDVRTAWESLVATALGEAA